MKYFLFLVFGLVLHKTRASEELADLCCNVLPNKTAIKLVPMNRHTFCNKSNDMLYIIRIYPLAKNSRQMIKDERLLLKDDKQITMPAHGKITVIEAVNEDGFWLRKGKKFYSFDLPTETSYHIEIYKTRYIINTLKATSEEK